MKTSLKVFKVFVDIDKEEVYLNEMANKGYFLKKYSAFGFYHFFKDQPQDLYYRVDYRQFRKRSDFEDYKALFEDAGWQHVYGTRYSLNQYFLPKSADAGKDIFSTKESAAVRYKTLYQMCYLNVFVALVFIFGFDWSDVSFLTPGLWEMSGPKFLSAFLFELPFVALRACSALFFLILGIVYAVWSVKAKKIYNSLMANE